MLQTSKKKYSTWLDGNGHLQGIVQIKLEFDNTTKWYLHKPESVQLNETNKIHADSEVLNDCLILVRRLDLELIKKKPII